MTFSVPYPRAFFMTGQVPRPALQRVNWYCDRLFKTWAACQAKETLGIATAGQPSPLENTRLAKDDDRSSLADGPRSVVASLRDEFSCITTKNRLVY